MTVIELLAASALAALMLAAVSGVLGALSRQRHQIISQARAEPWRRRFIDQIQWDFANARTCVLSPKQLTLTGYGGRDFATGTPTFRGAEIAYQIVDVGERSCLVRREVHPDGRVLDNSRTEIVAFDVDAIEARPLDLPVFGNRPPAPGAVPRKLGLKLHRQSDSGTAMETVLHVY